MALPDLHDGVARLLVGVACHFGPEWLQAQEAPPRIVWEPTADSFGPASQRGNSRADPTSRHTSRTGVDAHIWGEDWPATFLLRDRFIQALRLYLGSNYELGGGRYVGSKDIASNGKLYILSFQLNIPVTDPKPRTQVLTGELQDDVGFAVPT